MSHSATPDYYELLGVPRDADSTTIARAYRRLARVSHPDGGGNAGMFRLLRTAYETLTDDAKRRAYDADLDGPEPAPQPAPAPDERPGATEPTGGATPADARWQFDDGTARSMVVDPERLSWWSAVDPDRPVQVEPRFGQGRGPAGAAAAVFLVVGIVMVWIDPVALAPLVAGAACIAATFLRSYRGAEVTTIAGAVGAIAVVTTGVYMYLAGPLFAVLLGFGLLAAFGATVVLTHRYGQTALLDRLAPQDAVDLREYGRPGVGHRAGADEQFGDRIGADALLPLTFIPGVRVFHGLADLDGGPAISHVVVCGRLVALVESKYWEPGTYAWTPHGALMRDDQHFPGGDLGFDTTVAVYRQALGDGVDVRGFVLVASAHPGPVVGGTGPTGITLGPPQSVVDELGRWFLQAARTDLVDRRLLVRLYEHRTTADGGQS